VAVTLRGVPSYSAETGFWAMSPYSHEEPKGGTLHPDRRRLLMDAAVLASCDALAA
jgi:hypothetical protein